jgi:hypothetical protein
MKVQMFRGCGHDFWDGRVLQNRSFRISSNSNFGGDKLLKLLF